MRLLIAILASATLLSAQTAPYAPKQSDRPEVLTGRRAGIPADLRRQDRSPGGKGTRPTGAPRTACSSARSRRRPSSRATRSSSGAAASPADFELKLDYRITEAGNSGINYRSVVVPDTVTPDNKFAMKGYQFDLDGRKRYDGNNYEEKGRLFLAVRGQMSHVVGGRPPIVLSSFATSDELASVPTVRLERGAHHRARQHGDAHPQRPPDEHHRRRRCAESKAGRIDRHAGARRPADEDRVPEYPTEALVDLPVDVSRQMSCALRRTNFLECASRKIVDVKRNVVLYQHFI